MRIKKILSLILLILLFSSALYAAEKIKILLKVNNKIITNIDVEDEYRYLLTLNAQLKNINLQFINKIINQDTYSKSIKFIQNNSTEIKKLEDIITDIFPNVFKRLSS